MPSFIHSFKKGWKNSALNNFAASFATIINKELDLRFGEMGILGKFSIFNPVNHVDMDIKTLESYGIRFVCPCGDLTGSGRDLAWFSGV